MCEGICAGLGMVISVGGEGDEMRCVNRMQVMELMASCEESHVGLALRLVSRASHATSICTVEVSSAYGS